jgi:hypothetical protein
MALDDEAGKEIDGLIEFYGPEVVFRAAQLIEDVLLRTETERHNILEAIKAMQERPTFASQRSLWKSEREWVKQKLKAAQSIADGISVLTGGRADHG